MSKTIRNVTGSCCCGKVRYRAAEAGSMIIECHCLQCRKQAGYRSAHVQTRTGHVEIEGEAHLSWYRPFPEGERGFCSACGSHMFWRSQVDDELTLLVASIDNPEGFELGRHVYADEHAVTTILRTEILNILITIPRKAEGLWRLWAGRIAVAAKPVAHGTGDERKICLNWSADAR